MKIRVFIVFLFICFLACNANREENAQNDRKTNDCETVRSQNKDEILDLLDEPDRINENHLYYMIAQKRLGSWPLHTKTMVIKLSDDNTIDWIKIHE